MENCLRELEAIMIAIKWGLQDNSVKDNQDLLVWTDNTNCMYNLNRKRSGWRMRQRVKEILQFLKQHRIRLECRHIAGEDNKTADALSRLCPGGRYHLKEGVVAAIEQALGVVAEVDLFADRRNTQKQRYWTLESDSKAEGRNAWDMPTWKSSVCLIHPPIPLIVRALVRVRDDKATAILIAPAWWGMPWTNLLKTMMVKSYLIGKSQEVLIMEKAMLRSGSALPLGNPAAYLVQG